jgi:hypothetical protein
MQKDRDAFFCEGVSPKIVRGRGRIFGPTMSASDRATQGSPDRADRRPDGLSRERRGRTGVLRRIPGGT